MELLSMPISVDREEQETALKSKIGAVLDTEHEIYFYSLKKRNIVADIIYTDFRPTDKVKEMVCKLLPASFEIRLHRKYSYQVITQELFKAFCKNDIAILECINGELISYSIKQFIYKQLREKDFYQETITE